MRLRTSSQQQQRKSATPAAASVTAPSPTPPPPSAPNSSDVVVELKEAKSEPKEEERSSSLVPQPPLKTQQKTTTTTVCYCNGQRKLGNLEVHCAGCKCWFHQNCFRNLDNFGGLPFMVSYQFLCQNCAPEGKEKWTIRSTSYSSMAVMTMANMTLAYRIKQCGGSAAEVPAIVERNPYFSVDQEIVKYMEDNWEYLSTTPKRQKKTWHHTILKILQKETDLFEQEPQNEGSFALKERDLLRIGPMHESVIQLFKRSRDAVEREANALQIGEQQLMSTLVGVGQQFSEGPKTRGASKRKAAAALGPSPGPGESTTATEGSPKSGGGASGGAGGAGTAGGGAAGSAAKKAKTSEFATVQIDALSGATVDFPFNREGYRYYLVEKDPNIPNREQFDTEEVSNTRAVQIPSHIYRLVIPPAVTLSPNDRANQLLLDLNNLNVAVGHEGYGMARASHSVSHGCWYFEMEFLSQPGDSHVRVGWAQSSAVLQACVGYTKASYSWRSKRGTRFHDGYGWHYHPNGYRQGDVVGCLIQLPPLDDYYAGHGLSEVLPASKKDCDLIKFKQTCFFEEKEETQLLVQRLKPLPGSRIEFFLNGHSCGTAFRDIYAGHYFPAVSLFQSARVRLNFGPAFRRPPACVRTGEARPMSQRPEQMQAEQAVADLTFMVANQEELEAKNANYINAILAKESAQQQAAQAQQQQQQQQSKAAPTPKDDGKY